jgi:hypothetical protein
MRCWSRWGTVRSSCGRGAGLCSWSLRRLDFIAEGVKGDGYLAAGLVDPLADLGVVVDGEAGSKED